MKRALLVAAALAALAYFAFRPVAEPVRSMEVAPVREAPRQERFVLQEARAVAVPAPELAELASALGAHLGRGSAAEVAIADARAGRIEPPELRRKLHELRSPQLGALILHALVEEKSPLIALPLAQALAELEDDAALRAQTIDELRAKPDARGVGLLALLGRGDEESLRLAADTLADAAPEARATAAFLLNNAPSAPPSDALASARAALGDPRAGDRLREEAATLLGKSHDDFALLESAVFDASEPAVRMRAFAALEMGGADLRPIADRVARDSSAPERLAEMARLWRTAHP